MNLVATIIRKVCEFIAKRRPERVITRGDWDDEVYLGKYYLFGPAPKYFSPDLKVRLGFFPKTVFLHHFPTQRRRSGASQPSLEQRLAHPGGRLPRRAQVPHRDALRYAAGARRLLVRMVDELARQHA